MSIQTVDRPLVSGLGPARRPSCHSRRPLTSKEPGDCHVTIGPLIVEGNKKKRSVCTSHSAPCYPLRKEKKAILPCVEVWASQSLLRVPRAARLGLEPAVVVVVVVVEASSSHLVGKRFSLGSLARSLIETSRPSSRVFASGQQSRGTH